MVPGKFTYNPFQQGSGAGSWFSSDRKKPTHFILPETLGVKSSLTYILMCKTYSWLNWIWLWQVKSRLKQILSIFNFENSYFLRYIWWHHLYSQSWMVLDLIKSINTHCGTDILVCDSSCQKSFQFFSSEISISSATLLTILNSFLQIVFSLNLWFCQKGKPCPHSLTHFHFLASWKQGLTFFLVAFSCHNFD